MQQCSHLLRGGLAYFRGSMSFCLTNIADHRQKICAYFALTFKKENVFPYFIYIKENDFQNNKKIQSLS